MADAPSIPHLTAIQAVLSALPDDLTAVRAALVCEDAYIACSAGAVLGLSLPQIRAQCLQLLTEVLTDVGPPADS